MNRWKFILAWSPIVIIIAILVVGSATMVISLLSSSGRDPTFWLLNAYLLLVIWAWWGITELRKGRETKDAKVAADRFVRRPPDPAWVTDEDLAQRQKAVVKPANDAIIRRRISEAAALQRKWQAEHEQREERQARTTPEPAPEPVPEPAHIAPLTDEAAVQQAFRQDPPPPSEWGDSGHEDWGGEPVPTAPMPK